MLARGSTALVLTPILAIAACLAGALLLADVAPGAAWVLFDLGIPLGVVFVFLLVFFRDPERVPGPGIVSAADGRVVEADPARNRVVVFMSLRNVHVNRAPWDGRVARMTYARGGHAPAQRPEASRNERLETVLETALGPIVVTQVAGALVRRIVPYRKEGDRVRKGQRIGMIRFGSRVELVLPPRARVTARVGERVRAGETTVAEVARGPVP